MAKVSELGWYRVIRAACVVAAVAALALLAPALVQLRIAASAERPLGERCYPASLVRRGDAMGLSAPHPAQCNKAG